MLGLENLHIVFLIWLLANLLTYVIVGGLIIYAWEKRNKKNLIQIMNDEDKKYLMRHYGVKDEEDLELPPSLPISLLLGGSGRAKKILQRYMIEGAHITDGVAGMINNRTLYEFAVYVADPNKRNRMTVGRERKYYGYMLLYGAAIFFAYTLLWALIPYVNAAANHFETINQHVYNFCNQDKIKLVKQGKGNLIAEIEALQRNIK